MTDINTSNAIVQERARIREEVVKLPTYGFAPTWNAKYLKLEDVLKIIRNDPDHGTA